MHKWDNTFWMMFILLEAAVILGNIWYFTPIGVIIGFALIAVALARFGDHLFHKKNSTILDENTNSIERVKGWLNNQHQLTQGIKDLHEYRFHRMEKKKIALDEKMEKNYRELAGKIIDVENRLNLVSRALISQKSVAPEPMQVVEKPVETVRDFFDDVWEKITHLAERDGYVETLSRGVKNSILEIGNNGIKLRSELTKKERFIAKDEFRHFWNKLQGKGKLDLAKDIEDPKMLRLGSVIISFLARLPNVEHDVKPRMLYLKNQDTHNLGTLKRLRKKL